jgi:hypothetical protein
VLGCGARDAGTDAVADHDRFIQEPERASVVARTVTNS